MTEEILLRLPEIVGTRVVLVWEAVCVLSVLVRPPWSVLYRHMEVQDYGLQKKQEL